MVLTEAGTLVGLLTGAGAKGVARRLLQEVRPERSAASPAQLVAVVLLRWAEPGMLDGFAPSLTCGQHRINVWDPTCNTPCAGY